MKLQNGLISSYSCHCGLQILEYIGAAGTDPSSVNSLTYRTVGVNILAVKLTQTFGNVT